MLNLNVIDLRDRWERREERINRPNREAGLSVSNSARFVTRKIS